MQLVIIPWKPILLKSVLPHNKEYCQQKSKPHRNSGPKLSTDEFDRYLDGWPLRNGKYRVPE